MADCCSCNCPLKNPEDHYCAHVNVLYRTQRIITVFMQMSFTEPRGSLLCSCNCPLQNPEDHYCAHATVLYRTQRIITVLMQPLLSQLNSAHVLIPYLLMNHCNIIISSTTTSSNVPLQVPLEMNY